MTRLLVIIPAVLFVVFAMSVEAGAQNVFPPSGNVGIGTPSPNEKLVVNGGNSVARIAIDSGSPTANAGIRLRQDGTSRWSLATVGPDGDFRIYEDDAGVNRLVIKGGGSSHGNVGIGTTSPGDKLHVNDGNIRLSRGASWPVIFDQSLSSVFTVSNGGQIRFSLNPDGNVGIGTVSPADRLHVYDGNIRLARGGSWPVIFDQSVASVFTIQNGGQVSFILEPDGKAAIARLRPLADGEYDFGHVCRFPRFPEGATQSQGWYFSVCSSAKEYVPTIDAGVGYPEAGDLVSIVSEVANPYGDPHTAFVVARTRQACDSNLLGFITDPVQGGADGKKLNEHYLPLAIYGYFPAKVTLENGPVKRGDPITSSSKPGHGMKATRACKIIGYAVEDADKDGTIQVFANLSEYAAPEVTKLQAQVRELEARLVELEKVVGTK